MDSEQSLVIKARKGDAKAFQTLVERYQNYAFNLAFRMMKNREEAEEVAQDAFIKVYRSLDQFREDGKFVSWLYTIVYRESLNRLRKTRPRIVEMDISQPNVDRDGYQKTGLDVLTGKERARIVRKALHHIKPSESAILTMFYLDELSLKEVAEITGLTESNIKIQLFRGRKSLLEAIQTMYPETSNDWL